MVKTGAAPSKVPARPVTLQQMTRNVRLLESWSVACKPWSHIVNWNTGILEVESALMRPEFVYVGGSQKGGGLFGPSARKVCFSTVVLVAICNVKRSEGTSP